MPACAAPLRLRPLRRLAALGLVAFLAAAGPDPRVEQLIRRLGSDSYAEREAAARALEGLGAAALPALRTAARGPDPEVRARAGRLVEAIEGAGVIRARDEAVAAVGALGGRATLDPDLEGRPVCAVFLAGKRVADADLAGLARMPGLAEVESVTLRGTAATDGGVGHLRAFRRLSYLEVTDSAVTGAGLAGLEGLEALVLDGTAAGGPGLASVRGLAGLKRLSLRRTKVTGADLVYLKGLRRLRVLRLAGTGVDDDGLAHLAGLGDLLSLDLDHTRVTDRGLRALEGLGSLWALGVEGTRVSDAGLARLRRALPDLLEVRR
jgi:hypothetical protein